MTNTKKMIAERKKWDQMFAY